MRLDGIRSTFNNCKREPNTAAGNRCNCKKTSLKTTCILPRGRWVASLQFTQARTESFAWLHCAQLPENKSYAQLIVWQFYQTPTYSATWKRKETLALSSVKP
uniref:Uncharacterized protein n=1 Tax=Anopheles arabiensis TaxID=7173 RepID=A0A182I8G7_ANOAR